MAVTVKAPSEFKNTYEGFQKLIKLYPLLEKYDFEEIILDFSRTNYFEANLAAVLGAIIDEYNNFFEFIKLANFQPKVEEILRKNDFLSFYGYEKHVDSWGTTVPYQKFKSQDDGIFANYLNKKLFSLLSITPLLKNQLTISLCEIFVNAHLHGNCKNIYACGQYFPQLGRIDFTIVDIGKTIKQNVIDFYNDIPNLNINGTQAIVWAVKEETTTKKVKSGGAGLYFVKEFCKNNGGKLQIISADGYWEQTGSDIITNKFEGSFPGTIVNLEINCRS